MTTTRADLPQARVYGAPAIARPTGRLPMRIGFCSHFFEGAPFFDPYYCSIADAGKRRALRQFKLAHGITGIVLARRYNYDATEPYNHLDGREMTWTEFLPFVDECVADGLYIHAFLAPDRGPDVVRNGELVNACRAMRPYASKLYAGVEWESSRTGAGFRTADNDRAILLMREGLGDDALLVLHTQPNGDLADGWVTGASFVGTTEVGQVIDRATAKRFFDATVGRERLYWVEDDDASGGDEIGWWYTAAGLETDVLDWQSRHGSRNGPAGTLEPRTRDGDTWLGRLIESAERFLEPGAINYYGQPVRTTVLPGADYIAPDWFSRPRRRGRPQLSAFELAAMEFSRNQLSIEQSAAIAAAALRTGVTSIGMLAPA